MKIEGGHIGIQVQHVGHRVSGAAARLNVEPASGWRVCGNRCVRAPHHQHCGVRLVSGLCIEAAELSGVQGGGRGRPSVALQRKAEAALNVGERGRAGIGQARRERWRRRIDQGAVIPGVAHLVGENLHRISRTFNLPACFVEFAACVTDVEKHVREANQQQQANGERDHHLDERKAALHRSPAAPRTGKRWTGNARHRPSVLNLRRFHSVRVPMLTTVVTALRCPSVAGAASSP